MLKRDPASCFADVLRVCAGEAPPRADVSVRKLVRIITEPPADLVVSPSGLEVRFAQVRRARAYFPELGPGLIGGLLGGRRPPCRFRCDAGALDPVSLGAGRNPVWIWIDASESEVRVTVRVADQGGDPPLHPLPLPDRPRHETFLLFPTDVGCPHCGNAVRRVRSLGSGIVVCEACGRSRSLEAAVLALAVGD
jgi:hypothetical protein